MDFNRFTEKLQEGVRAAQSMAGQRGNQQLDVEHLLLALADRNMYLAKRRGRDCVVDCRDQL